MVVDLVVDGAVDVSATFVKDVNDNGGVNVHGAVNANARVDAHVSC